MNGLKTKTIFRKDRKSLPRPNPHEQTLDDFKAKKYDYSIDNKMLEQKLGANKVTNP